jgi:dTMP kinase
MILENFVVFEGCDGAGTTTQQAILRQKLEYLNINDKRLQVFSTSEPTNSPIGKLLRSVLADSVQFSPETIAFLFAADRSEHIFGQDGIKNHCQNKDFVICDRYVLSSLAYQGISCGEELPKIINSSFPAPELLIFFDIESEKALQRIEKRGKQKEIYEYLDFQVKVRKIYKKLLPYCAANGSIVEIIDAGSSIEEVSEKVWIAVQKMSIFKK